MRKVMMTGRMWWWAICTAACGVAAPQLVWVSTNNAVVPLASYAHAAGSADTNAVVRDFLAGRELRMKRPILFVNAGDAELTVQRVRTTCVCLEVSAADMARYAPGSTGAVDTLFIVPTNHFTPTIRGGFLMLTSDPSQTVARWQVDVALPTTNSVAAVAGAK